MAIGPRVDDRRAPGRSLAVRPAARARGKFRGVIEVVPLSDKQVRDKVFARARRDRPVVITMVRTAPWMRPVDERPPFAQLEALAGDRVDLLVVTDAGTIEGMWRDPLGDLADTLFPHHREKAYAAASGYLLLVGGKPRAVVKKHGDPGADAWFVQAALAEAGLGVPPPDPARRPGRGKRERPAPGTSSRGEHAREASSRARAHGRRAEPRSRSRIEDEPTPRPAPPPAASDPFTVLGIARDVTAAEAKKAFRALIAQYHPDKVAHLAPEFQELADRKTRELLEAWEEVERLLAEDDA